MPQKRHPNFKTGIILNTNGYYMKFVGRHHHLSDVREYAYVHRLNAEKKLGRKLKKGEQVHHVDENKTNNKPSNLKVFKNTAHHLYNHRKVMSNKKRPKQKNKKIFCACGCNKTFWKYDSSNRLRKFILGHNNKSKIKPIIERALKMGDLKLSVLQYKTKIKIQTLKAYLPKMNTVRKVSRGNYGLIKN